jgi:glycerol-3-phosphate dehydrogenase (NAD(P)+)
VTETIGILGAGAWGTALALAATRAGRSVTLWSHRADQAAEIAKTGRNAAYLPAIELVKEIHPTAEIGDLKGSAALLLAVPAQAVRRVVHALGPVAGKAPIIICAKGIERGSGLRLTEIVADMLPKSPVAVLSGPSFASEVANGLPTAVTIASSDAGLAQRLTQMLGSRSFRPYPSDDPIGVELGGAAKNVLAIACGIAIGRALGDNARAALITRGLAEMTRFAVALGGRASTLSGLAGMGDLVLTCSSQQSRNLSFGTAVGQGKPIAELLGEGQKLVEGVATAAALTVLAKRSGVEMPIASAVDAVLHQGLDVGEAVTALLSRPFRSEFGDDSTVKS